jgi:hypothetical protein
VTCLLPPQIEISTVGLRRDIMKSKTTSYPMPKLPGKYTHREKVIDYPLQAHKEDNVLDGKGPRRARLSAVQQRLWATSHRKNLHFLGAQVPNIGLLGSK